MNKKTVGVCAAMLLGLGLSPLAGAKGGTVTLVPAGDIKWVDVPDMAGVKMAALQGDPGKGAAHFLVKLPGGFQAPLHHHTADHYAMVLSGTIVFTVDGKETKLPAGSYFSYTGKRQHVTQCEAGADCVLAVDARNKWDVVPEGKPAAKPAAKK